MIRRDPACLIRTEPARPADLAALAALHLASWRSAYAGQVPPEALGDVLTQDMAARWAQLPDGVICARRGDALVGFIRLKQRMGWPYIDNLHVAPGHRGQRIGDVLMHAGGRALAAQGAGRVWLTVLSGNGPARRFYRRMGGVEMAPIRETLLGETVMAHPVVWGHLGHLPGGEEKRENASVRA